MSIRLLPAAAAALCTDNGAMIAVAGYEAWRRGVRGDGQLVVDAGWTP